MISAQRYGTDMKMIRCVYGSCQPFTSVYSHSHDVIHTSGIVKKEADCLELHTAMVPTLKWCPKSARPDYTRLQANPWGRIADRPRDIAHCGLEARTGGG